jgi:hypothetical protein
MDCLTCKSKLLQQGAVDQAAVVDSLGDNTNQAWCKVCAVIVCLPSDIPMDIYADYDLCEAEEHQLCKVIDEKLSG